MDQVMNSAGIVSRRVIEILQLFVLQLKVSKERNQFSAKRGIQLFQFFKNVRTYLYCMGNLQRNHSHRKSCTYHHRSSLGISYQVKLSCRTHISFAYCSSHHSNSLYFCFNVRKSLEQNSEISHGSCHYEIDWFGLGHQQVVNVQKRLVGNCFLWGFEELYTLQSRNTMDVLSSLKLSAEGTLGSFDDNYILPTDLKQNVQSILSGVLDVRIACRC